MNSNSNTKNDLKRLFTTTQNFELMREKLGEYKSLPTKEETRDFLEFLDEVYQIWKKNNPSTDYNLLEKKAKARREFVYKLGIMSD